MNDDDLREMARTTIFSYRQIASEWQRVSERIGARHASTQEIERLKVAFPKYLWYCAVTYGSPLPLMERFGMVMNVENFLKFAEGINPR